MYSIFKGDFVDFRLHRVLLSKVNISVTKQATGVNLVPLESSLIVIPEFGLSFDDY